MYDMRAHGCNVLDPFKKLLVHWSHVMFVDDTYICHTAPLIDASEQQLKNIVEHDLRYWYTGLNFSGGALNLKKTNYFVLRWKFQANGTPVVTESTMNEHRVTVIQDKEIVLITQIKTCLLYTSPSPRDRTRSRMPSSA